MIYRQINIDDPDCAISCVWELSGSAGQDQRVVPDGHAEIVVHLAERFHEVRDGQLVTQARTLVCGQITRPLQLRGGAVTHTLGFRLRPWATGMVAGADAVTLTDDAIDGAEGKTVRRLAEVGGTDALEQAITVAAKLTRRPSEELARARRIVEYADRSGGQCTVDELANVSGWSARHLDRVMLREVGVTPKMFLRLLRFRGAMQQAASRVQSWAELAAEYGYHDQSHMIRDFRQFAGMTPTEIEGSDLAREFVAPADASR